MGGYQFDPWTPTEPCRTCGALLVPGGFSQCYKCRNTITVFSVGYNMPGYLPQADEPTWCETFEDAKASLLWEMNSRVDMLGEDLDLFLKPGEYHDPEGAEQAMDWGTALVRSLYDLSVSDGPEWGETVDDCSSGTSYWIVQETTTLTEWEEYNA